MTNVSVLLMADRNYGYYIHGRSPHGMTDVSYAAMTVNMAREEVILRDAIAKLCDI